MAALEALGSAVRSFSLASAIDILTIAIAIYLLLVLLKGTTAMSLVRGIVIVLVGGLVLTRVLDLPVLDFIIRNSFPALLIAIPIIFQPEIRRFLERVGRTGRWPWPSRPQYQAVIDVLVESCLNLSQNRHGALIVLERESGLEEYIGSGIQLDAVPSAQLLEGIFYPNSALHDGAVVLRSDRVISASCALPLSERIGREQSGLRHQAAVGVTERSDAVSIVVSEETGSIAVAVSGRLISRLDGSRLRAILRNLLVPTSALDRPSRSRLQRLAR